MHDCILSFFWYVRLIAKRPVAVRHRPKKRRSEYEPMGMVMCLLYRVMNSRKRPDEVSKAFWMLLAPNADNGPGQELGTFGVMSNPASAVTNTTNTN